MGEDGERVLDRLDEIHEQEEALSLFERGMLHYAKRTAEATERIDKRFQVIEESLEALSSSKMLKLLGLGRGGNDGS